MPSSEVLLTFVATSAIFAFIPGPGMLYAAVQTMAGGRRTGLMAALGIHLGGYVHVFAAAGGLSVLFHTVPALYLAMKLLGAAYLIWLGLSMLRTRNAGDTAAPPVRSASRAFLHSVSVEVLNPKAAIFYLAFLPQFASAASDTALWLQLAVLGATVNTMFSIADITAVLLADVVMARLRRSSTVQRWLQRIGGAVLIGLGANLAVQRS